MTTSLKVLPADRADFARFDDDGGAPTASPLAVTDRARALARSPASGGRRTPDVDRRLAAPAPEPGGAGAPRLSLSPARGQGSFDGGWWPRTMRLADELSGLLTALATADENIRRVSVNGDAWTAIPGLAEGPGLPRARVNWFRTLDPRVVTAGGGSNGGRSSLRLLVIPPGAAPEAAPAVLRSAAAGGLTGSPGEVLRQAGAETATDHGGSTGAAVPESSPAPSASP
ncbi:DUF5994 family protein [Frankia sp. QA3]|uniref:DUF5994 family protein n=1 Tax=Frankia sp. QA3 TaxID=710111 RepID=UPI000269C65C|nr:DUF5994 family protein [Frankia sp. QA3]EIV93565.1 hypothetical protein FraQA3DRAFT_3274 [Frankia sp. QA3]